MDELAKRIKGRVADARSRLTIVRNADRFLSHPDTQNAVSRECGILLLPISSAIELRVRYELTDKASEQNVCYVIDGDMELLPDMQPYILDKGGINLSDLMPAYDAMEIKKHPCHGEWLRIRSERNTLPTYLLIRRAMR